MLSKTILGTIILLSTALCQLDAFSQVEISEFCFEVENPSNASSIQILDADDNPYLSQTVGNMTFTIEYREEVSDPWVTAGTAEYLMETDAGGFLQDNGTLFCSDFGGLTIPDVSQIQISMNVNAGEWQATGLEPWRLDNVTLLNGSDTLLAWDYETNANASFVDPLISSNGGLGDAWGGDLTSPVVTGGAYEFVFPEGGGGGGGFVYDVATIPEPNSLLFLGVVGVACLGRRRQKNQAHKKRKSRAVPRAIRPLRG